MSCRQKMKLLGISSEWKRFRFMLYKLTWPGSGHDCSHVERAKDSEASWMKLSRQVSQGGFGKISVLPSNPAGTGGLLFFGVTESRKTSGKTSNTRDRKSVV